MEWFIGLPIAVQSISVVLFLFLLFGLGYLGKFKFTIGSNTLMFGRSERRTCGDCILLIMGKRERLESQREFVLNRILKEQMSFTEQKLENIHNIMTTGYRELMVKHRTTTDSSEENKQYRLYQGLLNISFMSIKDEIRRSCKENGFETLSGTEFSNYVKAKAETVISIHKGTIGDLYPYEGMLVPLDSILKNLESSSGKFEDICFEIYIHAKQIKITAITKLDKLNTEFGQEIDEFLLTKG